MCIHIISMILVFGQRLAVERLVGLGGPAYTLIEDRLTII